MSAPPPVLPPETPAAWLAIAGPTASGKTAAALAIAARWPVEIISVDSALVYRGMDIGTAKPTAAERATVPHHLIDIRDPRDAYSAAEFVADAQRLIHDIRARGRWPLLVGGTMLYFKALFDGLDDLPPAQPALRAAIEAEARARGWPALHAELARVDPVTAARLPPNDAQRIGRALEVWRATGTPLSALQRRWARSSADRADAGIPRQTGDADGEPNTDCASDTTASTPRGSPHHGADPAGRDDPDDHGAPLRIGALPGVLLSLEPRDRTWLHRRIGERFVQMLDAGLVDEVRALRARGDLHAALPSMRCVGYRQTWEALDAAAAQGRETLTAAERAQLAERGAAATRQLAKRQLTWLRSIPQRRVIAADEPIVLDIILDTVNQIWQDNRTICKATRP